MIIRVIINFVIITNFAIVVIFIIMLVDYIIANFINITVMVFIVKFDV